jgi:hypothetical protein
MSQAPREPSSIGTLSTNGKLNAGNVAAIAIVTLLVIGFGYWVWQLRPKEPPTGRPIGAAGKIQTFAVPAQPSGEGFTIWRDGRQIYALPNTQASSFQRIELSSNDVDIAGTHAPDLVLYGWTGGAHCCFTQILIDGQSGRLLGKLELGNGDPMPFVPATKPELARAVAVNFDDVTAYQFGSYNDSPMARIVVAWDGKRFALDAKRMKASGASAAPTYFVAEPDLGDAVPLGIMETGESEDLPAPSGKSNIEGGQRGDRVATYRAWMETEETRMRATKLDPSDVTSFGPMAAFLNERIYKGQVVEGLATVLSAYEATPAERSAALSFYFDTLSKSRWISDLDRLNEGKLLPIVKEQTSASTRALQTSTKR